MGVWRGQSDWHGGRLSRRQFVVGAGTLAAAGVGAGVLATALDRTSSTAAAALSPICAAMHVHACASEGVGSMAAQLTQAERVGVDVLWWTEHDHRMNARYAARSIPMTGLQVTPAGSAPWEWSAATTGSPVVARHEFITVSNDAGGVLDGRDSAVRLTVTPAAGRVARHFLDGQSENWLNRTSLDGMTISFAVRPVDISSSSYLSLDIVTSFRPAHSSHPAGLYTLSYRIGGGTLSGISKLLDPTSGLVSLAADRGVWTTLTVTPEFDLTRLWTGIDGRDASLHSIQLTANSRSGTADGYLADLHFVRTKASGQVPLDVQRQLMASYAPSYPTVRQYQGLEVSLTTPHLCWYGGTVELPSNAGLGPLPSQDEQVARDAVERIAASGGVSSYCHPFGTSTDEDSAEHQAVALAQASTDMIKNRALGCNLLEVGYRKRGGCSLDTHVALWDALSRNAILLTGIGTSDDHSGRDWVNETLNFVTWIWSANADESSLLRALRAGRAFFGDVARFGGTLDLLAGRRSVMGSILPADGTDKTVTLSATNLPRNGTVDIHVIDVDRPASATPALERHTTVGADQISKHGYPVHVPTDRERFVRVTVSDHSGLVVALSNPVWFLTEKNDTRLPPDRVVKST